MEPISLVAEKVFQYFAKKHFNKEKIVVEKTLSELEKLK